MVEWDGAVVGGRKAEKVQAVVGGMIGRKGWVCCLRRIRGDSSDCCWGGEEAERGGDVVGGG